MAGRGDEALIEGRARHTDVVLGAEESDLVMAVIRGDVDEVRRAHEAGVDLASVTVPGGSLLGWAAEWGRAEILTHLLAQGIEVESNALSRAADKGHAEVVRLLLDHGMNPDPPAEWPPLCAAADQGSPECVQALLQAGARVDLARRRPGFCLEVSDGVASLCDAAPSARLMKAVGRVGI